MNVEDIYDEFNYGLFSPIAIKEFIKYAYYNWQLKPKYILLVGDATASANFVKDDVIPTYTVNTFIGGNTASDNYYADINDDTIPDIAIGRLPVNTPDELKIIINKIINYEKAKFGIWKKKIEFVFGDDENITKEVATFLDEAFMQLANFYIPYDYDINLTIGYKGSYYNYVADEFQNKVIDRINSGCLTFNYIGHGLYNSLCCVYRDNKSYYILSIKELDKISIKEGAPIVILTCCLTGYFDNPASTSLAEELLKKENGPVAIIASSRISDPYGNVILQKELMYSLFTENKTIGEVINLTKYRIISQKDYWRNKIDSLVEEYLPIFAEELKDLKEYEIKLYLMLSPIYHNYLYNLFGDPATIIPYPKEKVIIEANRKVRSKELSVKGEVENIKTGNGILTIECRREKIIYPVYKIDEKDKDYKEKVKINYENANNKVLLKKEFELKEGKFEVEVILPDNMKTGRYYIKVYVVGEDKDAIGSKEFFYTAMPTTY